MKTFKEFLFLTEAKQELISHYFNLVKNQDYFDFNEILKQYDLPPDSNWRDVESKFESIFLACEKIYEKWLMDKDEAGQWAVYLTNMEFENTIEMFVEDYDDDGLIGELYLTYEDDYLSEKFEEKLEPEGLSFDWGYHGFIFSDGSILDVANDDHRIIPIDKWYEQNIVTYNYDDMLTIRINNTMTTPQINIIDSFIQEHNVEQVFYDVYGYDDVLVNQGSFDVSDGDWDWYEIRSEVPEKRSKLKDFR